MPDLRPMDMDFARWARAKRAPAPQPHTPLTGRFFRRRMALSPMPAAPSPDGAAKMGRILLPERTVKGEAP